MQNEDDEKQKAVKIRANHRKIIKIPRKYWIFGGLFGGGKGIRTLVRLLSNGFQEVAPSSPIIPGNLQNAPKFTFFSHFIGHLPENCEKNAR